MNSLIAYSEPDSSPVITDDRASAFLVELRDRARRDEPTDEIVGAYLTLRLLDGIGKGECPDDWGLRQVFSHVQALKTDALGRVELQKLLALATSSPAAESDAESDAEITTTLADYALRLEHDGLWTLAADIHELVTRRALSSESHEYDTIRANAYVRLGHCHRHLNHLHSARNCFRRARRLARIIKDEYWELRAVIADAMTAHLMNESLYAENALRTALAIARRRRQHDLQSRALHGLSSVVVRRGEYLRSFQLLHEALLLCSSEYERDRILGDSCYALVRLGAVDLARIGYLSLASTGHERFVRWAARLNLMQIAVLTGSRPEFDEQVRALLGENLTFEIRIAFQQNLGEGLEAFGEVARAQDHFQRARAMTSEYGLNNYMVQIESLPVAAGVTEPAELRRLLPPGILDSFHAIIRTRALVSDEAANQPATA